jgi:hypothetical protein
VSDKERFLLYVTRKIAELREWPRELTIIDANGTTHVVDSGRDELLRQMQQAYQDATAP